MIPIADAISIVRTALYAALSPLCGTYNGLPRCYWLVAAQGAPLPLLVFQSQDGGGQDASLLGQGGWEGLITVKALATSQSAAEAALAGAPEALAWLDPYVWRLTPEGTPATGDTIPLDAVAAYTIRATLARPLVLPPKDNVWQAGQIYRIQLYRV